MPVICKFEDGDKVYYLEWSTIADAPITDGMSYERFRKYYRNLFGLDGMRSFDRQMEMVEKFGTNSGIGSLDDFIKGNRAGPNETELTKEKIIERYCKGEAK